MIDDRPQANCVTPPHLPPSSLRRRFQQNQEDCTYTVLALLPTAATKILETLDVEKITLEIQQMKGSSTSSSRGPKSDSMSLPETTTGLTDEDGRSMISTSESGVHASQITVPPASQASEADQQQTQPEKPKRTKRQLWGDVTISCECLASTRRGLQKTNNVRAAITRAFTLVYTLALLTMLTRIQLNLLGRRSYLSSVVSLATGSNTGAISLENKDDDNSTEAYGDDFEVNRKYLTFSWWLLNKGWVDLMQRVEAAVRQVFGQLSPRDQLTFETFSNMTAQVRKLVEGGVPVSAVSASAASQQQAGASSNNNATRWLTFLLPPPDMEDYVLRESGILDDSATFATQQSSSNDDPLPSSTPERDPPSSSSLRRLLDETADLVETPTFTHVLTQILDAGFATLLEKKLATGAFDLNTSSNQTPTNTTNSATPPSPSLPAAQFLPREPLTATAAADIPNPDEALERRKAEKKVLLPKCLSVLTRQAHAIGNAMPNEYLDAMEKVRDLEGFAAVVYSSNWENEIREEGMMVPSSSSHPSGASDGASTLATAAGTTTTSSARQSQLLGGGGTTATGEESLVLVDPSQSSFESVWAKVTTAEK